jgi:predicted dehydrogenase
VHEVHWVGVPMSVQEFRASRPIRARRVRQRCGVSVAVVGCGYWGEKHARVLNSLPDVSEVTVVDQDEQTRTRVAAAYPGTESSPSLQAVLSKVDAVVVATPPREHATIALQALRAGKHVLVEKPLATNLLDAQALVGEAMQRNLVLMVGHTFEFSPAIRELRNLIDAGVLGEVRYINSARLNLGLYRRDVDVVWDLAPHDISIMNYLLRSYPRMASGWGSSHIYSGLRDIAHFQLEYSEGSVLGYGHVSWLDPRKVRQMTVVGSRRMAVYDDLAEEPLRIYDRAVLRSAEVVAPTLGAVSQIPTYTYGEIVSPHIAGGEPLKIENQHFLDCINNRAEGLCDGRSGVAVVGVLEAIDQSLAAGHKMPVILPEMTAPVSLSERVAS